VTFLAPLAGLLAGALGLGVLLALHALKLRRRPVRVSSTLLWREAVRDLEVNIPFRAPRLTWLFVLQALAILLLAGAIARPVLGSAERIPGRLIVVIDASASMSARDAPDNTTRLDRAKDQAAERLANLRRGSGSPEIAVVRAALEPRMVVAPTRSIDAALAGIRSIQPTDQPLDPDALRAALTALLDRTGVEDESAAAPPDASLWIFTDAGDLTPSAFPGWSGEIITTNPPPSPDTPPGINAGIVALTASRDPSDPASARVFVRLISNADRPTGVVLRLTAGDTVQAVPLEIPAAAADAPGSTTRAVILRAGGAVRIEASLENGGVLPADDRAWTDLPDARPPRTVVFAPEGRPDPFLLDVLAILAPGAVSTHAPEELDALTGAELVIYDRVNPARLPPVPSLGFASAWPGTPDDLTEGRRRVIAWDRTHPVLRDVSLATVVFDRAVSLPDESTPGTTVLAESNDGPVFTEGLGNGVRHLRVAFPLNRSNWAVDVGMPIFVAGAYERLVPGVRGEGTVHTTNRPVELRATAASVRANPAFENAEPLEAPAADAIAVLGPFPRAGLYTLTGAAQPTLAVSMLDASESAIPLGQPARFGRDAQPRGGDPADTGPLEGRRELWPTLLLAAFVVMTLEWLLHARRARV
jgi:hypothetical protein